MSTSWIVAFVALTLFVALLSLVVLGVARRVTSLLERAEARLATSAGTLFGGAFPGTAIPSFNVYDKQGRHRSSVELLSGPQLVLFMASGCKPCDVLAAELAADERALGDVCPIVIVDDTPQARRLALPSRSTVLYQQDRDASRAFQNVATPQAFAVRDGVVVDVAVPDSVERLRQLASRLAEGGVAADERMLRQERSQQTEEVLT